MLVIKKIMKGNRNDSENAIICASANNPKIQTSNPYVPFSKSFNCIFYFKF